MYKHFFKRVFDFILSGTAILILCPVFFVFIIVGAFAMKGNPFFLQIRCGKNGKPFKIIKFRSMNNAKDEKGEFLPNEQRITKYGKFIRKFSIDELPQIFNIFAGQMAIIGPRPLHLKYNEYYDQRQKTRLDVRPGLTGYAQVNGRNAIDWDEKLEYDAVYVERISFCLDASIFFKTIANVLTGKGISDASDSDITAFDEYVLSKRSTQDGAIDNTELKDRENVETEEPSAEITE